jgi:hypothetical protein
MKNKYLLILPIISLLILIGVTFFFFNTSDKTLGMRDFWPFGRYNDDINESFPVINNQDRDTEQGQIG